MLKNISVAIGKFLVRHGAGIRTKLVAVFLIVYIFTLLILASFSWRQVRDLGSLVIGRSVDDAANEVSTRGRDTIERLALDVADVVADFLGGRDRDIALLASMTPTEEAYRQFAAAKMRGLTQPEEWRLADDKSVWLCVEQGSSADLEVVSSNKENEELGEFRAREPIFTETEEVPLYNEISFVDLDGMERIKVVSNTRKKYFPIDPTLRDISKKENTYVKAETWFDDVKDLQPGEIYVSEVIGAYVPTNYVGMYTPLELARASIERGAAIKYAPEDQAYAIQENPLGRKFEGIIRWVAAVADADGKKIGYVTFALDHDHIIEFSDMRLPNDDSISIAANAGHGSFIAIWDSRCRSIAHPRHSTIFGYDPETGDPHVPLLSEEIYDAWKASGESWAQFSSRGDLKRFDEQSRSKKNAQQLIDEGSVGIDGGLVGDSPQYVGWMDITRDGGVGSLYHKWGDEVCLTAAASIPYYTGRYAPSEANGMSRRGFGIVTVGSNVKDFFADAAAMEERMSEDVNQYMLSSFRKLVLTSGVLIAIVCLVAFAIATWMMMRIGVILRGMLRLRQGELHHRLNEPVKDEFGMISDAFDRMADGIRDNYNNALVIIGKDGRIIHMNDIALGYCGKTIDEVVGRSYCDVSIYPHGTEYDPIESLRSGVESEPIYVEDKDVYLRPIASPYIGVDGNASGYLIESVDVTEKQKMTAELKRAIDLANEASKHKSDFLARMSHEIRTPMNAIIGVAGMIHRRLAAEEEKSDAIIETEQHLEKIEISSHHLLSLLNDVLDISKIESGNIDLVDEDMPLEKLTGAVNSSIASRCADSGINFVTKFYDHGGDVFRCDTVRLRQAVINILNNALKFTPRGGTVEFDIEKLKEEDGRSLLRFTISDTGIGMAQDTIEKIFQPFEQADKSIAGKYGGVGLGLPISRSIVKMFGGDIAVESEVGKGSKFSFEIWLKASDVNTEKSFTVEDMEGKLVGRKMLIVDDVDINRMIVASMFEDTGIEVDEAEDGKIAVDMFERSEVGEYCFIFMDIQMPNMDGYEATRAIRSLDRADAQTVPIVALTANAFRDDVQKAMESGMNEHIAKPVEEGPIFGAVVKYVLNGHLD